MKWEQARMRDKLRQEQEPKPLGAMTDRRRRFLAARRRELLAARRRPNGPDR
jgi:hypothetical protein